MVIGWRPGVTVPLRDLSPSESGTREHISAVQAMLFSTRWLLKTARLFVSSRVHEVLTVFVLPHISRMKEAHSRTPVVARLEQCALDL